MASVPGSEHMETEKALDMWSEPEGGTSGLNDAAENPASVRFVHFILFFTPGIFLQ